MNERTGGDYNEVSFLQLIQVEVVENQVLNPTTPRTTTEDGVPGTPRPTTKAPVSTTSVFYGRREGRDSGQEQTSTVTGVHGATDV